MKNLGLDLDGTVYDWHTQIYNHQVLYKGYEGSFNDLWGTDLWKTLPLEYLAGIDIFYSSSIPNLDVIEFLDFIRSKFNVYYITARPENVKLTTEQYMKRYDFPGQDNLIFSSDKVNVARKLGLDYMIEDSISHVENLSKVVNTIMIARPWNRSIQGKYPTITKLMDSIQYLEA